MMPLELSVSDDKIWSITYDCHLHARVINNALESSIMLLESSIMFLESSIMLLESSIMLLESSIMLIESSIMFLENTYSTGFTHGDHHMAIVCLLCRPFVIASHF